MKRARRFFTSRHSLKWGALTGLMGGATVLLQYIPDTWPKWLAATLTLLAFAVTGMSRVIAPDDGDGG